MTVKLSRVVILVSLIYFTSSCSIFIPTSVNGHPGLHFSTPSLESLSKVETPEGSFSDENLLKFKILVKLKECFDDELQLANYSKSIRPILDNGIASVLGYKKASRSDEAFLELMHLGRGVPSGQISDPARADSMPKAEGFYKYAEMQALIQKKKIKLIGDLAVFRVDSRGKTVAFANAIKFGSARSDLYDMLKSTRRCFRAD